MALMRGISVKHTALLEQRLSMLALILLSSSILRTVSSGFGAAFVKCHNHSLKSFLTFATSEGMPLTFSSLIKVKLIRVQPAARYAALRP